MVVAADHATFGIPRGSSAACSRPGGGLIRLPKRIPLAFAYELALTGDPVDANRALELGLVNRVVPADELLPPPMELPSASRRMPRCPVRYSKQLIHDAPRSPRRRAGGSTTRRCA